MSPSRGWLATLDVYGVLSLRRWEHESELPAIVGRKSWAVQKNGIIKQLTWIPEDFNGTGGTGSAV